MFNQEAVKEVLKAYKVDDEDITSEVLTFLEENDR